MENQHRHITGYRELSAEDIALMNEVKQLGAAFAELQTRIGDRINAQFDATKVYISVEEEEARDREANGGKLSDVPTGMVRTVDAENEWNRMLAAEPHRWRSIAVTGMQQALMALTRAVAQPGSF